MGPRGSCGRALRSGDRWGWNLRRDDIARGAAGPAPLILERTDFGAATSQEYNTERPHSVLGDLSPAELAAQMQYFELMNVRPESKTQSTGLDQERGNTQFEGELTF